MCVCVFASVCMCLRVCVCRKLFMPLMADGLHICT